MGAGEGMGSFDQMLFRPMYRCSISAIRGDINYIIEVEVVTGMVYHIMVVVKVILCGICFSCMAKLITIII